MADGAARRSHLGALIDALTPKQGGPLTAGAARILGLTDIPDRIILACSAPNRRRALSRLQARPRAGREPAMCAARLCCVHVGAVRARGGGAPPTHAACCGTKPAPAQSSLMAHAKQFTSLMCCTWSPRLNGHLFFRPGFWDMFQLPAHGRRDGRHGTHLTREWVPLYAGTKQRLTDCVHDLALQPARRARSLGARASTDASCSFPRREQRSGHRVAQHPRRERADQPEVERAQHTRASSASTPACRAGKRGRASACWVDGRQSCDFFKKLRDVGEAGRAAAWPGRD